MRQHRIVDATLLIPSIDWVTSNSNESLDSLNIIDQQSYDYLSKKYSGSATIPIKGVPFKFDSNWDQFRDSRSSL